jgi:cell division protein FtsL
MEWTWDNFISIGIIVIINVIILIVYLELRFFKIRRKLVKINKTLEEHLKKLGGIESKLERRIKKEERVKEKNRKQKLTNIKNEIDEILYER